MKELSIEEKAKAYDKAIERAKDALNDGTISSNTITYLQDIFSELKESKDEKIRKFIIHELACLRPSEGQGFERYDELTKAIAWLEKQGEHNNIEDLNILHRFSFYSYKDEPNILYLSGLYVNEECRNKGIGTKILKVADEVAKSLNCHAIRLKTKKDSNAERLYQTHGYNSLTTEGKDEIWLEKQDEQKCNEEYNITGIKSKNTEGKLGEMIMNLKSVNEVLEQKPADNVEPKFKVGDWIIGRATSNEPRQISEITDQCYKSTYGGQYGFSFEDEMHLWTIQDAKAGDALADENSIVIFRKIGNERWSDVIDYYAVLYKTGDFLIQRGIDYWGTTEGTDLRPTTKEQRDLLFQKMHEAGYEWDAKNKELKKIEQKPAEWSEEDDKRFSVVIAEFAKCAGKSVSKDEWMRCNDWLNSLKDRVQLQPVQEWNGSDDAHLHSIITHLQDFIESHPNTTGADIQGENVAWLKSIRPQNRWKPSEEQMDAIQTAIREQLKKLTE